MIQSRKILELYHKGMSQRSISASIGTSRQTVSKVIHQAKEKELGPLRDEMTNQWLKHIYSHPKHRKAVGLLKRTGVMCMNKLKRDK